MAATVRLLDGEKTVAVRVLWRGFELNLLRDRQETVERFLVRFGISCAKLTGNGGDKKRAKKEKKKPPGAVAGTEAPVVHSVTTSPGTKVRLLGSDGSEVEGSSSVEEALQKAAHIEIDGDCIPVRINPPAIRKLEAFGKPLAGCPLVASLTCEFCDASEFALRWYVGPAEACSGNGSAKPRGEGRYFVVPDGTEGQVVTLQASATTSALPDARGTAESAAPKPSPEAEVRVGIVEKVAAGWPERRFQAFEKSHEGTAGEDCRGGHGIRVVCYNILAAPYAKKDLYPYCAPDCLDFGYRQPLLGRDLKRLDGDIVCLQECQQSTFTKLFMPAFSTSHHLRLSLKATHVQEGVTMMLRKSAFEIVEERDHLFKDVLTRGSEPAIQSVLGEVRAKWPNFVDDVLPHMSTVFQISAVRHLKTGRVLIVSNTHLFFHPQARHIRLLQVFCLLHLIEAMRAKHADSADRLPHVVLCGDLNCIPETAVLPLLKQGQVDRDHPDWQHALRFTWRRDGEGDAEEEVPDQTTATDGSVAGTAAEGESGSCDAVEHSSDAARTANIGVALRNPITGGLVDTNTGAQPMEFTNYVHGFKGLIDYVFVSKEGFRVQRNLPGVPEEELLPDGGLPSAVHPSDHLPIAVDLELL